MLDSIGAARRFVGSFVQRTEGAGWVHAERVALTWEQVERFDLPPMPGKSTDSRSAAFVARHGGLVQVELDALTPADLVELYRAELDRWWDDDAYRRVLALEREERQQLSDLSAEWDSRPR